MLCSEDTILFSLSLSHKHTPSRKQYYTLRSSVHFLLRYIFPSLSLSHTIIQFQAQRLHTTTTSSNDTDTTSYPPQAFLVLHREGRRRLYREKQRERDRKIERKRERVGEETQFETSEFEYGRPQAETMGTSMDHTGCEQMVEQAGDMRSGKNYLYFGTALYLPGTKSSSLLSFLLSFFPLSLPIPLLNVLAKNYFDTLQKKKKQVVR